MTTGRINQVTVQRPRARARKWLGELLGRGSKAAPGRPPGVCHRSFNWPSLRRADRRPPRHPRPKGLSTQGAHTASSSFPVLARLKSCPPVAQDRGLPLRRGLHASGRPIAAPRRNAAVPRLASCNKTWPKAINPHRSPSLADAAEGRSKTYFRP